jgi:hypothetical protein
MTKKRLQLPNIDTISVIYPNENQRIQRKQSNPFLSVYKISGCSSVQTPRWLYDFRGRALQTGLMAIYWQLGFFLISEYF